MSANQDLYLSTASFPFLTTASSIGPFATCKNNHIHWKRYHKLNRHCRYPFKGDILVSRAEVKSSHALTVMNAGRSCLFCRSTTGKYRWCFCITYDRRTFGQLLILQNNFKASCNIPFKRYTLKHKKSLKVRWSSEYKYREYKTYSEEHIGWQLQEALVKTAKQRGWGLN